MRKHLLHTLLAGAALIALPLAAHAGPTYQFAVSAGLQPTNVGTITLKQITSTTVDVLVDLHDTSLPAPQYGFLNTGGPHTPFGFNLSGGLTGITAIFSQPANGVFASGPGLFTLSTGGGDATPYGNFNVAINDSAGNGSGKAYYGDLEFRVTRTGGLSTDNFIGNSGGYYFAADLTSGPDSSNTGSQAWNSRQNCDPVTTPEPGSIALLGVGLIGLGTIAARRRNRSRV